MAAPYFYLASRESKNVTSMSGQTLRYLIDIDTRLLLCYKFFSGGIDPQTRFGRTISNGGESVSSQLRNRPRGGIQYLPLLLNTCKIANWLG
jgi:hypothetical protein